MPARIACPSCAAQLVIKDEFAGRAVKCPKCGAAIPAASNPPAFEVVDGPAAPPPVARQAPKPAARPDDDEDAPRRPAPRRARYEDDEDDDDRDRPRPRRDRGGPARPEKKSQLPLVLGIVAVTLLTCCGTAGYGVYWFVGKTREAAQQVLKDLERQVEQAKKDAEQAEAEAGPKAVPPKEGVTRAGFDRLLAGMSRAEVEAILGGPGEPVTREALTELIPPKNKFYIESLGGPAAAGRLLAWKAGGDVILAAFTPSTDPTGRLQSRAFQPATGLSNFVHLSDAAFAAQFTPPAGGEAVPPGPGQVTASARELARAYRDGRAEAEAKYKDQWVEVEGVLEDVAAGEAGDITATMARLPPPPGSAAAGFEVRLRFLTTGEARRVLSSSRGQPLKVKGRCVGATDSGVDLSPCSVVSAGPSPGATVTVTQLLNDYAADPQAAAAKYENKPVTLTAAAVRSISGSDLVLVRSGALGGTKSATAVTITAHLSPAVRKQLQDVRAGAGVRVHGELTRTADEKFHLNRCWVIR